MSRLKDARIAPEKFDLAYLRFEGGRYGVQALQEIQQSHELPADLREKAGLAKLAWADRSKQPQKILSLFRS